MFEWIKQNVASILVLLVLLTIIALIIVVRIKATKRGVNSCNCGCDCSSCASKGMCHTKQKEE